MTFLYDNSFSFITGLTNFKLNLKSGKLFWWNLTLFFKKGFWLLKLSKTPFAMVSCTKKLRFYPLLITIIIGIDINLYFGKFLHRTILERRVSFILGMCRKVRLGVVLLLLLVLVVTLENKVNSEPDLFKFVQVRSGWVPSRVGVWQNC